MNTAILEHIFIIFMVAVAVVIVCNWLKIPFLIGYLLTGVLLSPKTSGLLGDAHEVEMYAEIGVVLLLFTVGLEFSFSHLSKLRRYVLVGGLLQVFFTVFLTALLIFLMGRSLEESVFWGFVISLSSTAIVIKVLQDKMMLAKEYGKVILSYLLFQDVALVPLMLFTPILAGEGGNPAMELGILLAKLALMGLLAWLLSKWIIPFFFKQVFKVQSQEIFLIATIFVVAGIALLTSYLGLSLSLGAFLAGLIIAETDYNKLAISCFIPFRYVFISFFFIAMGMLLDYRIFVEHGDLVLFWFVFILAVKTLAGVLASLALKVPFQTALIVGFSIAQIGEFSFVLSKTGLDLGLISETNYQIFLADSILTMAIAPVLVSQAPKLSHKLNVFRHAKS